MYAERMHLVKERRIFLQLHPWNHLLCNSASKWCVLSCHLIKNMSCHLLMISWREAWWNHHSAIQTQAFVFVASVVRDGHPRRMASSSLEHGLGICILRLGPLSDAWRFSSVQYWNDWWSSFLFGFNLQDCGQAVVNPHELYHLFADLLCGTGL